MRGDLFYGQPGSSPETGLQQLNCGIGLLQLLLLLLLLPIQVVAVAGPGSQPCVLPKDVLKLLVLVLQPLLQLHNLGLKLLALVLQARHSLCLECEHVEGWSRISLNPSCMTSALLLSGLTDTPPQLRHGQVRSCSQVCDSGTCLTCVPHSSDEL